MKTFSQLNLKEQRVAIEKITETMTSLIEDGVIVSNKRLSKHAIKEMVIVAAESAFYPEDEDGLIYGVAK